jgi:hypothetical protein
VRRVTLTDNNPLRSCHLYLHRGHSSAEGGFVRVSSALTGLSALSLHDASGGVGQDWTVAMEAVHGVTERRDP